MLKQHQQRANRDRSLQNQDIINETVNLLHQEPKKQRKSQKRSKDVDIFKQYQEKPNIQNLQKILDQPKQSARTVAVDSTSPSKKKKKKNKEKLILPAIETPKPSNVVNISIPDLGGVLNSMELRAGYRNQFRGQFKGIIGRSTQSSFSAKKYFAPLKKRKFHKNLEPIKDYEFDKQKLPQYDTIDLPEIKQRSLDINISSSDYEEKNTTRMLGTLGIYKPQPVWSTNKQKDSNYDADIAEIGSEEPLFDDQMVQMDESVPSQSIKIDPSKPVSEHNSEKQPEYLSYSPSRKDDQAPVVVFPSLDGSRNLITEEDLDKTQEQNQQAVPDSFLQKPQDQEEHGEDFQSESLLRETQQDTKNEESQEESKIDSARKPKDASPHKKMPPRNRTIHLSHSKTLDNIPWHLAVPQKQSKKPVVVKAQLDRPEADIMTDLSLVTRNRRIGTRQRPQFMMVVVLEGVMASFHREQNSEATGADFYDEDDEDDVKEDEIEIKQEEIVEGSGEDEDDQELDEQQEITRGVSFDNNIGPRSTTVQALQQSLDPKSRANPAGRGTSLENPANRQQSLKTMKTQAPASKRAGAGSKLKGKKKDKKELRVVVYEEVAATAPLWMSKEQKESLPKPAAQPTHSLFFRHGVSAGMRRLYKSFYIVIIIQRKSSRMRQKQIINALADQAIPFDAMYQYEKEFNAGVQGDLTGCKRYFSIDKLMSDTGYTPTQTVFLTAVDQSSYNVDINEYLEKDQMPPPVDPQLADFGLMPMPFTLKNLEVAQTKASVEEASAFQLTFHKLVMIGVPHVLPNNVQPSLNKAKSISFKHITTILKNFYELCLQFNKRAKEEIQQRPKTPSESDISESNSEDGNSPGSPYKKRSLAVTEEQEVKYKVNPKYVKTYNPQSTGTLQKKESDPPEAEKAGTIDDSKSYTSERTEEKKVAPQLIKETKVFYKGFKKAKEHGLFSLVYQSSPSNSVEACIVERFMDNLVKYKKKISKIDGLAIRLLRRREKQDAEEKEMASMTIFAQQVANKENALRYDALRRQPALQSSQQYLKSYYKEIYDECNLQNSKIVWPSGQRETGPYLGFPTPNNYSQQTAGAQNGQQPSFNQLQKLRQIYQNEVDEIERLIKEARETLGKSHNIMSLQGQLYTAKKMDNYGPSSQLKFKPKLVLTNTQTQKAQTQLGGDSGGDDEEIEATPAKKEEPSNPDQIKMPAWCNFISLDGKKVTDFKGTIPVEQVRNIVNWLSKKQPSHVVQFQEV